MLTPGLGVYFRKQNCPAACMCDCRGVFMQGQCTVDILFSVPCAIVIKSIFLEQPGIWIVVSGSLSKFDIFTWLI